MSLFRRETRSGGPFAEPINPPFPGVSLFGGSGGHTSIEMAMQTSAVWACVSLLADSVSMMPLGAFVFRNGVRVPIDAPAFLRNPSADASMSEWIYMGMVSLLLRGNAFGKITDRDSMGRAKVIEWMNPDAIRTRTDPTTGELIYETHAKRLDTKDVFHVRAYRMPGSHIGLSPITYAASKIRTTAAINEFAYGYFRDGAHPSSILSSPSNFDAEQARSIKERFMAAVKGREPAILTGDLKYQSIQVNPEESQFLKTLEANDVAIARMFRVPPNMVGMPTGDSMTYSNDNQRVVDYLTFSVQSWLTRFESALAPILPGSQHFRFDTGVLLRTDIDTLIKAGSIAIASKQYTPDEVRAWNDYPPLTDAQKSLLELVPLTVSPSGRPTVLRPGAEPIVADPSEGNPA